MYTYVHLHTTVARHAGRPEDNSLGGDSCCLSVSVICTSLELGVTPVGALAQWMHIVACSWSRETSSCISSIRSMILVFSKANKLYNGHTQTHTHTHTHVRGHT